MAEIDPQTDSRMGLAKLTAAQWKLVRLALDEDVARWADIGKRYEESGAIGFVHRLPPEDEANDW